MATFNQMHLLNSLAANQNQSVDVMWPSLNPANDTAHQHCPSIHMPVVNWVSMVLYVTVALVGLTGNSLVVYVVLRFANMQTITNMFILHLATADICFLVGIPFLIATVYAGEWTFGQVLCKGYMVSTSVTQFTSSLFLCVMSADRYLAVCHPIAAPSYRTPALARIVSALVWTTSAVFMLPVLLYARVVERGDRTSCAIAWPVDAALGGSGATFIWYSLALGFAVPLALILGFYCAVLRKLQTVGANAGRSKEKRRHWRVTRLVLTVIAVYLLCWLPYWAGQLALIHSPPDLCKSRLEVTIFVLVGVLGYSNSAMNPVLYAFLSDHFQKAFRKAFTATRANQQLGLGHPANVNHHGSFVGRLRRSLNSSMSRGPAVDRTDEGDCGGAAKGRQEAGGGN